MGYIDGENTFINNPKDEGYEMVIEILVVEKYYKKLNEILCYLYLTVHL